jgi:hypothetical protein
VRNSQSVAGCGTQCNEGIRKDAWSAELHDSTLPAASLAREQLPPMSTDAPYR